MHFLDAEHKKILDIKILQYWGGGVKMAEE